MRKVCLTGATGFIGSSLYQVLSEKYHTLTITRDEIADLSDHRALSHRHRKDIVDKLTGCHAVFHLASIVHQANLSSPKQIRSAYDVNCQLTQRLVALSALCGVGKFIFTSSLSVYDHDVDEVIDESSKLGPCSVYGITKLLAEQMIVSSCASFNMDWVIFRLPLVYGPNAPGNFQNLVHLLAHSPLVPFANIHSEKSLLALPNLLSALLHSVESNKTNNQIFVLSDQSDLTFSELCHLCLAGLGRSPKHLVALSPRILSAIGAFPVFAPTIRKILSSMKVDSSKFTSMTDWSPPISPIEFIPLSASMYLTRLRSDCA